METFWDRERAFRTWIRQHDGDGCVLNCVKGPDNDGQPYLLHRANCRTLTNRNPRTGRNFTTSRFYKVCSTNLGDLAAWGKRVTGGKVPRCKLCFR
jgi:hypothetical protein